MATELFGIRGARAFNALSTAGPKALADLRRELELSTGAAERMANIRLDNLTGQLTLLGSSLEGFAIEFFQPLLKGFTGTVRGMISGINNTLFSIQKLKDVQKASVEAGTRAFMEQGVEVLNLAGIHGTARSSIVQGMKDIANAEADGIDTTKMRLKLAEKMATAENKNATKLQQYAKQRAELEAKIQQAKEDQFLGIEEAAKEEAKFTRQLMALKAKESALDTRHHKISMVLGKMAAQEDIEAMARQQRIQAEATRLIEREKTVAEIRAKHGRTAAVMAEGVLEAIDTIKRGWRGLIGTVKEVGERFTNFIGEDRLKKLTKIALVAGVIVGALAPVGIALLGLGFVITSVIVPAVSGLGTIIAGLGGIASAVGGFIAAAFWPVTLVLGAVAIAFAFVRKENESVGETVSRVWGGIKAWALDVWNTAIMPFYEGLRTAFVPAIQMLGQVWDETVGMLAQVWGEAVATIKQAFSGLTDDWGTGTQTMATDWFAFGKNIVLVFGTILKWGIKIIGMIFQGWALLVQLLAPVIVEPFAALWNFAKRTFEGIKDIFKGNFLTGMKKIATALLDILMFPFRMVIKSVLKLASMIPKLGDKIPDGLKDWAEHGFAGPPKKVQQTVNVLAKETERQADKLPGPTLPKGRAGKRAASITAIMQKHGLKGEEGRGVAESILEQKAAAARERRKNEREAARKGKTEVALNLKDDRKLNIQNQMCVDGRNLVVASSEAKQNLFERSGATNVNYQRRLSVESGNPTSKAG
jgi:hypothetical protein